MKKIRILAFAAAAVTAILLFLFLKTIKKPETVKRTGVIVAAADIPSNTAVTKSMVELKYLPTEAVYTGAITDAAQVIGRVATSNIVKGEQLIGSRFAVAGKSGADTLAYSVRPGMRAVTIAVDNISGLAGMLKPGNNVDVIAIFQNKDETKAADTNMLLENIKVLAVDSTMSESGIQTSKNSKTDTAAYTSVTLEVTPDQAMKTSLSEYKGKLKVILRSSLDSAETNTPDITLKDIIK